MITKRIQLKTPAVVENLPNLPKLPKGMLTSTRSDARYNPVRYNLEKSGQSFPEELWALGAGYDIFGNYAFGGSSKLPLFDWDKAEIDRRNGFDLPKIVSIQEGGQIKTISYKADSALKIQTKFSASIDSGFSVFSLFSSTVTQDFNLEKLEDSKQRHCLFQLFNPVWKLAFNPKSPTALKLLNPEFKEALMKWDPFELFRTYGTHFLNEMLLGARLEYASSTLSSAYSSELEYNAAVEASFNFLIGNLDAGMTAKLQQSIEAFHASSEESLIGVGGDTTILGKLGNNFSNNKKAYEEWLASLKDNMAFMDFGSKYSLTGIWELADNPERKKQLLDAAKVFIQKLDDSYRLYSDKVVDVSVITGEANVPAPGGFEKYPYDLNKGAGGDYVYACFAKKSKEEIDLEKRKPIVDLDVIIGKNTQPKPGFVKIDLDLNKGVSDSDFIYLTKKFGQPGDFNQAISDIVIIGGNNKEVPAPLDYVKIPVDLNKGAGGEFIYLCYKKSA